MLLSSVLTLSESIELRVQDGNKIKSDSTVVVVRSFGGDTQGLTFEWIDVVVPLVDTDCVDDALIFSSIALFTQ